MIITPWLVSLGPCRVSQKISLELLLNLLALLFLDCQPHFRAVPVDIRNRNNFELLEIEVVDP